MPSFEDSMNTLLVDIYKDVDLLEEQMLTASRLNLSISEIHMLEAVEHAAADGAATISDLSEYLDISLPSVTLAVNKLAAKGYVMRQKDNADGRVVTVVLTQMGRKAERAHRYFHRTMVREIAAEMSDGEKEALISGIRKLDGFLKRNIQKYTR